MLYNLIMFYCTECIDHHPGSIHFYRRCIKSLSTRYSLLLRYNLHMYHCLQHKNLSHRRCTSVNHCSLHIEDLMSYYREHTCPWSLVQSYLLRNPCIYLGNHNPSIMLQELCHSHSKQPQLRIFRKSIVIFQIQKKFLKRFQQETPHQEQLMLLFLFFVGKVFSSQLRKEIPHRYLPSTFK